MHTICQKRASLSYTDVKIKDAARKIGKQFACGSSVSKAPSGAEEIVIQGDVLMDLPSFLETTFNVRRLFSAIVYNVPIFHMIQ